MYPVGHALSAWLDQLNSADHQESFLTKYQSWFKPESLAGWRADVGGYDLRQVYVDGPDGEWCQAVDPQVSAWRLSTKYLTD